MAEEEAFSSDHSSEESEEANEAPIAVRYDHTRELLKPSECGGGCAAVVWCMTLTKFRVGDLPKIAVELGFTRNPITIRKCRTVQRQGGRQVAATRYERV